MQQIALDQTGASTEAGGESRTVPSLCRLCPAHCGVLATVTDGKLTEVKGDPDNPLFKGYTCPKGRALPDMHNSPNRLLYSRKRLDDGTFARISAGQAMEEVAAKLKDIVDKYGPRSVALYTGTSGQPYPAGQSMSIAFLQAIGSPMFFTPNTIDQPGKQVAAAAHGNWLAGDIDFAQADAWLLVGLNPVLAKSVGVPTHNPAQRLKDAVNRGMQLIVVDPRYTETARRASIHIQPRPGEDPTILAGMIHVIIKEQLYDKEFVAGDVDGFAALADRVASFTPEYVAKRADVPAEQLIEAARVFATHGKQRGMVNVGTGPNFAQHGNLAEYLALCLTTICGGWPKAGQLANRPNVLLPAYVPKAQTTGPYQGWGYGEKMRVRNFTDAACGLPTSALAEEILLEGEGQVRALIVNGGSPVAAFPDQRLVQKAMEKLDLLVTLDVEMGQTSRLADYVIATKMTLETPGMTQRVEALKYYTPGIGFSEPYAQYSPRVVDPPAGSELTEEWEFYLGVAKRMGLNLTVGFKYGFAEFDESPPLMIDMGRYDNASTEDLYELMCANSRIPFSEVSKYPHGKVFDVEAVVQPKDPDCTAKLDVGNEYMMDELDEVASFDFAAERSDFDYPFRLISRRSNHVVNSAGHTLEIENLHRGKRYNPLYMHPDDMAELGLNMGDAVSIASPHDRIPSRVEPDQTLRRKVVAIFHCFGGLVEEDGNFDEMGSNVGRLIPVDKDFDPISGIPRMSNIPVNVTAGWD